MSLKIFAGSYKFFRLKITNTCVFVTMLLACALVVNTQTIHGEDEKMFKMEDYSEWGGLSIEFTKDHSSQSITILKEDKVVKVSAPNKKGSFDWVKIKSFNFKEIDEDTGILTVHFRDQFPGAEEGYMVFGSITKKCWNRVKANVMDEIVMIEEK